MEEENLQGILCRVCLQPQSISIAPHLIIFALIRASIFMPIFVSLFLFIITHPLHTGESKGAAH